MYDPEIEKYRQMQELYYSSVPPFEQPMRDHVVGCYDEHQKYPYEEHLLHYMKPDQGKLALDFGCGPGRMIVRMAPFFKRVDGVDISPSCLIAAKQNTDWLPNRPLLFKNDGVTLDTIADASYDFVYSTIAFHHINSYPIRMSLLREFHRVLKPGGRIAIQMFYVTNPREDWKQHTSWRESNHDAPATNGYFDVRISPENQSEVLIDLLGLGYCDVDHRLAPYPPPPHPKGKSETDWIFIHARKP